MPAWATTRLACPACQQLNILESGNLRNAGGLHHGRAPLPIREARGFVLVGIDAPELFAVGVVHADEKMVMFAAAIFAKRKFVFFRTLLRHSFCHGCLLCRWSVRTALSQGSERRTSTGEDSSTRFITAERMQTGIENVCASKMNEVSLRVDYSSYNKNILEFVSQFQPGMRR
jgi:hypothetical protein